ncbi:MAG: polyketide synthase, partial [bacterium]|nr:polyketide synthase [bacterium]
MTEIVDNDNLNGFEIAVIGMSGRFPGAGDIHRFWQNLKDGVESITFFSREELEEAGLEPEMIEDPAFVGAKGLMEKAEYFDAAFFNYTPGEAQILSPQIRLFHEYCWKTLEDAGYDPSRYDGPIGLYGGASLNMMWVARAFQSGRMDALGRFEAEQLASKDFLCTSVSYNLDLKGPSVFIQTACSTSLAAVDIACKALLTGQCDIALAGGVSLFIPRVTGYIYQEGMISSRDGHCRAFDAESTGTIWGEGVGVVALKSLEDSLEDGDHIRAVIKGSAINNDGIRKVGYTAPSVSGQSEVIRSAIRMAEVDVESIGYLEAHGTGTALGDPIEIEALTRAFDTDKKAFCRVGSVKTNIGHLDTAAGITGLIKTVLSLENKMIPPSLHFKIPNPKIDFASTPFIVNAQLQPWERDKYPRRAGVSSFGIGGTNAH